jgi:hypothetical protein
MLYRQCSNGMKSFNKPSKLFYMYAHSQSYYKISCSPDHNYLHKCWLSSETPVTLVSMSTSVCGLAHRRVTTRKSLWLYSNTLHTTTITYTTNRLVLNILNRTRVLPSVNSTVLFLFSEYWASNFVKNWWAVFFYTTFFTNSNLRMFLLFDKSWGNIVTMPASRGLLASSIHNTRYL